MSSSNSSYPLRNNPLIRLNSSTNDLTVNDAATGRPGLSRQHSARSLLSKTSTLRAQDSSNTLYHYDKSVSTEHLLPPKQRSRTRRYGNEESQSPLRPQAGSASLSRRSSWSSDGSRDSLFEPSGSPFDDLRPPSRDGSEDGINTQTVSEKYNIQPSAGLLLFPEDVEKDDWLHNPDLDGKEPRNCDICSPRGLLNTGGLVFIILGVLVLFIGYPVLTFVQRITHPQGVNCASDPNCISSNLPLFKNIRTGLIDPDTPHSAMTKTAYDGTPLNLVFSDEFNRDNRTFYENDDPYFQAVDLWYGVTQDLEWYDPDAITTQDGVLTIRFDAHQNHGLNYRSGMLQSWNQMCFKGGRMEASISLPGRGDTIGFWPGFWSMGNLGRPGYASTTDGLWPYSYWDKCDYGITKNQSAPDGLSFLPGMRLPACVCTADSGEHPSMGKSRSAPEIDALEASVGYLDPPSGAAIGSASQSAQIAPFDIWYQPNYDFLELYDSSITAMNNYRGGSYQQAISGVTNLNNSWYNGNAYQTYAFEYEPGATGYSTWFVGEDATWKLDARAIGPNGNTGQRVIPEEPMAMVINFGMSNSFANLNWTGLGEVIPATMRIDYIRIYQDSNGILGCDPPGYPTTDYIANHPKAYRDRDKTLWAQTGYIWPQNNFVDGCTG